VRTLDAARLARGLPLGHDDPPRLPQVALERVIRHLVHEGVVYDAGLSLARFGVGRINVNVSKDVTLDEGYLHDFRPAPLAPEQVEQLQVAMQLGGAEFATELIGECRRLGNVANDPNLPPDRSAQPQRPRVSQGADRSSRCRTKVLVRQTPAG
jgi:hypothetical protein